MHITQLIIYPVKGLRGISLPSAQLTSMGLAHDRRYMLVDDEGHFLSQRSHPQLALMETALLADQSIRISYRGQSLSLSPPPLTHPRRTVTVWKQTFEAIDLDDAISAALSQWLDTPLHVVYIPDASYRVKPLTGQPMATTPVSFADGYPILIAGSASLQELNSRLAEPVRMDRFRPNIVLATTDPHIEDKLGTFDLGTARLHITKPCVRCCVVTIDQDTATKGKEPLRTLATYRAVDKKVCFGANAIVLREAMLHVGDPVSRPQPDRVD